MKPQGEKKKNKKRKKQAGSDMLEYKSEKPQERNDNNFWYSIKKS